MRVTEVGGRGRQTGFGVQVHVEKMTWKTARQRAEWERAGWNILFFPGTDFCPGIKKVRKKKKKRSTLSTLKRANERKSNAGR